MRRSSKLFLRIAIGTAIVLLFALCIALLPKALRLETIKEEILSGIRDKTGCQVQFQDIDVRFFPRPCVLIRRGSFAHPRGIEGTFESLAVAPRISSLFSGTFKIAALDASFPRVALHGAMMSAGESLSRFRSPKSGGTETKSSPRPRSCSREPWHTYPANTRGSPFPSTAEN